MYSPTTSQGTSNGKWRTPLLLSLAELLAMSVWSASAVVPAFTDTWDLSDSSKSWLTMPVQIGFEMGWEWAVALLALGPLVGIWAMFPLRQQESAACPANGYR